MASVGSSLDPKQDILPRIFLKTSILHPWEILGIIVLGYLLYMSV